MTTAASIASRPAPASPPAPQPAAGSGGVKLLVALAVIGAGAMVFRLAAGLGASTNLDDGHPWGLWIAGDVITGVALAAGGYTMAAAYYVFGMKKYAPLVKPAVLTAFLGYAIVAAGIIFDIGKPWAFYYPLLHGQHHSVMFEVALCVMLYLTVLALEVAPVAAEGLRWARLHRALKAATYPLVIAGITLSFLHQSSLGAVFLLAKNRLSDLWYSPILPQHFFVSSIAVGIAMVSLEAIVSARGFGRTVELDLLQGLARGARITLVIYLLMRVGDLLVRGRLGLAFAGDRASVFFLLELGLGVVVPLVLYSLASVRASPNGLLTAASFVIGGVVLNRFDVTFFTETGARTTYFPALSEIALTVGLVAMLILAYRFLATRLPFFAEKAGSAPAVASRT